MHEKIWTCPHDGRAMRLVGPTDPHGDQRYPVRQFHEYVCQFCGNRMTPPGGLFGEGGARSTSLPGEELAVAGKLLSITCADFAHTTTGTAIITLDADAEDDGSGGLTVHLLSGTPGKMTIPATAVVPAGSRTKNVVVTGVAAGPSLLTASATGSTNKTVTATAS